MSAASLRPKELGVRDTMNQTTTKSESTPTLLASASVLQRKCGCGQHTIGGGECFHCGKQRKEILQRSATIPDAIDTHNEAIPAVVHEAVRSSGHPLDEQTQHFFSRFSYDFSAVKNSAAAVPLSCQRMTISSPGDAPEKEADRFADNAMRSAQSTANVPAGGGP